MEVKGAAAAACLLGWRIQSNKPGYNKATAYYTPCLEIRLMPMDKWGSTQTGSVRSGRILEDLRLVGALGKAERFELLFISEENLEILNAVLRYHF